jgi:hypothetical protein
MKQCWFSIFKPSLILTSLTGQVCRPSLPAKSASQASSVNLEMSKCLNVQMSNSISGSLIRVPYHPQIGVQNRDLKSGSQIGVPNRGPKTGSQIRVSNRPTCRRQKCILSALCRAKRASKIVLGTF